MTTENEKTFPKQKSLVENTFSDQTRSAVMQCTTFEIPAAEIVMDIALRLCLQTTDDAALALHRFASKELSAVIDGENNSAEVEKRAENRTLNATRIALAPKCRPRLAKRKVKACEGLDSRVRTITF